MKCWEPCGGKVAIGDVVRWTEGIWHESRRRKTRKATKIGARDVTAQVEACDARGFVSLNVLKCEVTGNRFGMPLEPLKKGAVIRRKRITLTKGGAGKLVQPDPPRPKVKSRFL